MQKWKKALSCILAGVMVLECFLAAQPMQVQAAEGQALPGTVYDIGNNSPKTLGWIVWKQGFSRCKGSH